MTDIVIAVFAVVSGVAAILSTAAAIYTASQIQGSSKQVDSAIAEIASAASAAQDEASSLKGQVGALRDQVKEARAQTKAISRQTDAIKSSADAAIRTAGAEVASAQAQRHMADVTAASNLPRVALGELSVVGFGNAPDKDGLVPISINWRFNNVGGGSFAAKSVQWNIWIGNRLPDVMPLQVIDTPGNDYIIENNLTSGLTLTDVQAKIVRSSATDVVSGKENAFFFARFKYQDSADGAMHEKCFGEQLIVQQNMSEGYRSSGGRAYQCDQ